ncbi:MAG TPA: M48 family metallopeptidase [Terriglobales bacterium]|nr:M48 family metallopeptidase [Terriglobales bacterium]
MRPIRILLLIVLAGLLPAIASPQQSRASSATPASASQPSASSTSETTEYTLPPDKLAKSKALYDLSGRLRIVGTVWSFVVLLGILYLGVAARYGIWAEKGTKYSFLQALIAVPLLLLTIDIPDWPLAAYSHHISLQYGLSVQGWRSWFGDVLKGEAISIVIGVLALWLLVFLIRRSPRRWWFYSWLIALPFIVFLVFIAPVVIEPMFNKFEPLEKTNPQLVEAIEKVTQRGGLSIPRDRMFLMKASEKTTELNAYVSGLGASKRVVVWDNTIKKMTIPETMFVFGHEMGHYVLNHIYWGLAATCVGLLIGLYVLYLLAGWLMPRVQRRWHIPELGSWAALPMIFLIFAALGFISQPISSGFSRMLEHNADIYGLEVTHSLNQNSQEVAAHAFQVLGEVSLDYPHPSRFVVFWYYDHPSIPQRVRFAHNYDPWDKGEQPKYVK